MADHYEISAIAHFRGAFLLDTLCAGVWRRIRFEEAVGADGAQY